MPAGPESGAIHRAIARPAKSEAMRELSATMCQGVNGFLQWGSKEEDRATEDRATTVASGKVKGYVVAKREKGPRTDKASAACPLECVQPIHRGAVDRYLQVQEGQHARGTPAGTV